MTQKGFDTPFTHTIIPSMKSLIGGANSNISKELYEAKGPAGSGTPCGALD